MFMRAIRERELAALSESEYKEFIIDLIVEGMHQPLVKSGANAHDAAWWIAGAAADRTRLQELFRTAARRASAGRVG